MAPKLVVAVALVAGTCGTELLSRRIVVYTYGMLDCLLILGLGLAHLTAGSFDVFPNSVTLVCFVQTINIVVSAEYQANEQLVLWVCFVFTIIGTKNVG